MRTLLPASYTIFVTKHWLQHQTVSHAVRASRLEVTHFEEGYLPMSTVNEWLGTRVDTVVADDEPVDNQQPITW